MRKLSAALVAVLFSALFSAGAFANSLPLFTGTAGGGCSEASQMVPCLNQLIQSINTQTSGLIGGTPTQATTTGTSIQALGTVSIGSNQLSAAGQALRVKCFGSGTATGTNTLTVQVGASTAFAVAGAATTAGAFDVEVIVLKTGTNTQQILSKGQFNATLTAETIVSGTNNDANGYNVVCSGTSTTTGNFTLNGMTVEQIR